MSLELKPCPFCGGGAEIVQIGNEATKSRGFEVRCMTWGCTIKKRAMVIRQPIEKAREYAVAAWNQRSDAAGQEGARGGEPASFSVDGENDLRLHPATANLVSRFMEALIAKLAAAEAKYGYSDGWASPIWQEECRRQLHHHAEKGDPRDVAAYAAFCWHHGWSTASPAEPSGWRPMESAPRDRTYILARVAPRDGDDRWGYLSGRCFVIRHEERTPSGYDLGWSVFPGFGGVSDDWFEGWLPLPPTSEGGGA
jgi:Lar family restriction alleviation protein